MPGLRLASDLTLPLDAATTTVAVIGKRGVGKSTTATVFAEELFRARVPVVIIDPLDGWFGLRASADGRSGGLPITVLGGQHGDAPLESTAGELVADLVVDERLSVVLSLRHLRKGEQQRFVTDFAERLYHRKGEDAHRDALHVVIDESDLYAPQRVYAGQERMLGAVDDLVRRGRSSGIGVTVITQRPAAIAKDVLTQLEVLICHRLISPQDRKAVEAWIEAHDVYDQRKDFMASLASLPVGTAWVWSPGYLELFQRVKIRPRETFDSAATPKAGAKPVEPKRLAPVDLARLRSRMAETIERAKVNDPRELRRQLAEAKAAFEKIKATPAPTPAKARRVEIPVLTAAHVKALDTAVRRADAAIEKLGAVKDGAQGAITALVAAAKPIADELRALRVGRASLPAPAVAIHVAPAARPETVRVLHTMACAAAASPGDPAVGTGYLHDMLVALAQRPTGLSSGQIALRIGRSAKSSSFDTYVSRARTAGWIVGRGDHLQITDAGRAALGAYDPLPEGQALVEHWLARLGPRMQAMLRAAVDAYPEALSKEALARAAGQSIKSSSFETYLSRLRALELIEGKGELRAAEELFG